MKLYPKDATFLDVAGATDRQREFYDAYLEAGCVKAAGRLLGIADQNIYTTLDKLVKRAADRGWTEHSDNTRLFQQVKDWLGSLRSRRMTKGTPFG
jgi:hypothetical protein